MKKYTTPEVLVEMFESQDVIALSAGESGEGGSMDWESGNTIKF